MNLTITLPRQDLLTVLREKREALEGDWDRVIAEIQYEINALPNTAIAVREWHVTVGQMLADDLAKINAKGEITSLNEEEYPVPDKPSVSTRRNAKSELEHTLSRCKSNKTHELDHLDAAIRLLDLASDDTVQVPTSQYEGMLTLRANDDGYSRRCQY